MTRRKEKHTKRRTLIDRKARIDRLLAVRWIADEAEIPPDAIPADPDCLKLCGSWKPPAYYRDVEFSCRDCGVSQKWTADDQQWYYEVAGGKVYTTAVRCLACRRKERERKEQARVSAGHAKPKVEEPPPKRRASARKQRRGGAAL